MSVDEQDLARRRRAAGSAPDRRRAARRRSGPRERQILTREGFIYFCVGVAAPGGGAAPASQSDLAGLHPVGGPFLASIFGGRAMLRRLNVLRRVPAYVFSGDPLVIDYTVENGRRWFAALALFLEDSLVPVDRSVSGATDLDAAGLLRAGRRAAIGCGSAGSATSPERGKYQFRDLDLGTRSPFGLVEHRVTISLPDQIVVYPKIGHLTRRWFQMQRQATENRRGPAA